MVGARWLDGFSIGQDGQEPAINKDGFVPMLEIYQYHRSPILNLPSARDWLLLWPETRRKEGENQETWPDKRRRSSPE
jgi:hypothetical protein